MTGLRPPVDDDSHEELVGIVRAEIRKRGRMTFARYMELVVAHPEFGYYQTSRNRAGASGDFLTAPETHPIFGSVVARQLLEMWEALGEPAEFAVREFGAGRGTLARQILAAFSASGREGLATVRYRLVDLGDGAAVGGDASEDAFEGVVLANEYLDALPFHRLVAKGGALREIYTVERDGWFADETGELSADVAAHIPAGVEVEEGQHFEVSPARDRWLSAVAGRLKRGFIMLFDYGYPRPEIHSPARFPRGTLKTYRRHDVGDDPYRNLGRQDITAHVDFSAVKLAARAGGLDVLGLTTQAEFVTGLGIDRDLMEIQRISKSPEEYLAARSAVMALLDPAGLGRFRVLLLSKNVDPAAGLSGLAFKMSASGL